MKYYALKTGLNIVIFYSDSYEGTFFNIAELLNKMSRYLALLITRKKINVRSANKFSNEFNIAVSVAFRVPSSVQSKK